MINNNNNLPPSLAKVSPGDRKQGINKCWPNSYSARQLFHYKSRSGSHPSKHLKNIEEVMHAYWRHGKEASDKER